MKWNHVLGSMFIGSALGLAFFSFAVSQNLFHSHFGAYIIQSGSMEPTIRVGSVVITKTAKIYEKGDIVTFATSKNLVTHRILDKDGFNFKTAGDANESFDLGTVRLEQIKGEVVLSVPFVGRVFNATRTPKGLLAFIIIPATIIVYEELKSIWREFKRRVLVATQTPKSVRFTKIFAAFPMIAGLILLASVSLSIFNDIDTSAGNTIEASAEFPESALANHLVISEIQIKGANANQDFVELYNPTDQSVDLTDWNLRKRTSSGSETSLVLITSGTIPTHGFFLWANNQSGYDLTIGADVSNTNNISENNSIALLNPEDEIVDAVAWGNGTNQFVEGTPVTNGPATNQSIERKANASSTSTSMTIGGTDELAGNGFDSNNNINDFILRTISQPQNSTSSIEPL